MAHVTSGTCVICGATGAKVMLNPVEAKTHLHSVPSYGYVCAKHVTDPTARAELGASIRKWLDGIETNAGMIDIPDCGVWAFARHLAVETEPDVVRAPPPVKPITADTEDDDDTAAVITNEAPPGGIADKNKKSSAFAGGKRGYTGDA